LSGLQSSSSSLLLMLGLAGLLMTGRRTVMAGCWVVHSHAELIDRILVFSTMYPCMKGALLSGHQATSSQRMRADKSFILVGLIFPSSVSPKKSNNYAIFFFKSNC